MPPAAVRRSVGGGARTPTSIETRPRVSKAAKVRIFFLNRRHSLAVCHLCHSEAACVPSEHARGFPPAEADPACAPIGSSVRRLQMRVACCERASHYHLPRRSRKAAARMKPCAGPQLLEQAAGHQQQHRCVQAVTLHDSAEEESQLPDYSSNGCLHHTTWCQKVMGLEVTPVPGVTRPDTDATHDRPNT
jgi:hypothetical protein